MNLFFFITSCILTILLSISVVALSVQKSKNKWLTDQAINRGYATWELDQEHYPPIWVLNWKENVTGKQNNSK